jgi:opacity protein-like surface antigen
MKNLALALTLFLFVSASQGQNFHVNLTAGVSNYQGDLQDKRFTISQANFAGGLGLSYDLSEHVAIRSQFLIGRVGGNDKLGRNKNRNLSFTSPLTEGQLGIEYYITPMLQHSLTPYLFTGIAVYHFNPYTFDSTGKKYYLQPLSTEGEGIVAGRDNYKLTQLSIPFGGGVKLNLSENINVGFEIGFRKLFTDYLDDVSSTYIDPNILLSNRGAKAVELSYRGDEVKSGSQQYPVGRKRGNPGSKDWYYYTGLTLSIRLGDGVGRYSEYSCPGNVL